MANHLVCDMRGCRWGYVIQNFGNYPHIDLWEWLILEPDEQRTLSGHLEGSIMHLGPSG